MGVCLPYKSLIDLVSGELEAKMVDFTGKRYGLILLLITLLVTLAALAAGCEESRGRIEGRVFDKYGKPIAGAIIHAENIGYPGILLKTGEDGQYSIDNIFTGKWDVEFYDSTGYQIGLETVTVIANEITTLNFTAGVNSPPENPAKIYIDTGK